MFEWLSEQYINLIFNFRILVGNPLGSNAVDLLRAFSLLLLLLVVVKLILHVAIYYRLRRRYLPYAFASDPVLFRIYREAARKVGLRGLPPLFRFSNDRPLVFTIGTLRPAVFLSPVLAAGLAPDELEAVMVHELTHIKRRDNLLLWILEVVAVFIPVCFVQLFAIDFVFDVQRQIVAVLVAVLGVLFFKGILRRQLLYWRELSCDDLSVDVIGDPLVLAASLIKVWRVGSRLPKHRWLMELTYAHSLLRADLGLESRVERLINYRRPRFKFAVARAARLAAAVLMAGSGTFLLGFHTVHRDQRIEFHIVRHDVPPDCRGRADTLVI